MALQKKNVTLPFSQGLIQKTSDASSPAGTLRECKNIQINKLGEIKKRQGIGVQVPSGGASTPFDLNIPINGKKLTSINRDLMMLDGARAFTTVSSVTKYKDSGTILSTELTSENVHEGNEVKVGPVAFKRVSAAAGSMDIYLWTQTNPTKGGEKLGATYQSFFEVKETGTNVVLSPAKEIISVQRETMSSPTFDETLQYLTSSPQTQMLYSDTTDQLYFFYYEGPGTTNIKFKRVDLSGSTPSFGLVSGSPLISNVCPTMGTFVVDSYNNGQTMYFLYYGAQAVQTHEVGDLNLARITESGGGSLSSAGVVDVTNNIFNTTDSQRTDLATKTGCRVNLALRALNPSATKSVFIAYSAANTTKGGNDDYKVFIDFYNTDLSGSLFQTSSGTEPHGLAHSLDSRHAILNAATAEIKSGSGANVVYDYAIEICGDQGQSLTNALKGSLARNATGGNYRTGLMKLRPSTSSPLLFGEVEAQILATADPAGTLDSGVFDIIHAGNQFIAGTNAITQDLGLNGSTSGVGGTSTVASGNIETDQSAIEIIKPAHGIYKASLDSSQSLPSGVQNILASSFTFKDASLASDMMLHAFDEYNSETYFAVSKTVGNSHTNSGNAYISNFDGEIVATFLTGSQPLNFTSEIKSRVINKFSLMNGVSRVHSAAQEFIFGSNKFLSNIDLSADLNTTSAISVSSDQKFSGTTFHFKKKVDREYPSQEIGLKTYIGGGSLFVFDGTKIVENNFWEFPKERALKAVDRVAGKNTDQTVAYAFVFSSLDESGDLHESATSISDPISKTGTQSVCGQVYITDSTRRSLASGSADLPQLDIYRTEDNGTIFYKIQSVPFSSSDSFVTFIDDFQNTIDKEQALYTTGGIPDNFTTGSISDICYYKNRLIVVSAGQNITLASRFFSPGFAAGFPLIFPFQIFIQDQTEEIVGVEKMPDFLLCFTKDNAYAVFGDGPLDTGSGGFTGPKNIGPGQGMVPGSEHLSTSMGVYYASARGLYLVNANTQIQYLGAQVEDSVAANGSVKSIVLNDQENEVRMLMSSNSVVLIYNTLFQQWYQWELGPGNTSGKVVDQRIIDGSYFALQGNGTILKDSKAGYQDTHTTLSNPTLGTIITQTTTYLMEVKLNNISANELQGAQRVYRVQLLGDYVSSHSLEMEIFNDYASSATESHSQTISSDSNPYLFQAHLTNQKSRAISVKLKITGTGETVILKGLAFEVGSRAGTFKLPSAQTISG